MLQMQSIVVFIFRISSFILLSVSVGIAVSICIIAAIGAAASIGIIAFIGAAASIGITVCTVIFKFFHFLFHSVRPPFPPPDTEIADIPITWNTG